jgi:hypothetical protein
MIVQDPETNTEAPLLGKEGTTMLELWKAQMDWLFCTGQLNPSVPAIEEPQPPEPAPTPAPE